MIQDMIPLGYFHYNTRDFSQLASRSGTVFVIKQELTNRWAGRVVAHQKIIPTFLCVYIYRGKKNFGWHMLRYYQPTFHHCYSVPWTSTIS